MSESYRERRNASMNTSNSSSRKWPAASADRALRAWHDQGIVFVRFVSGHELSFPINGNPRLESAEEADLSRIEISPFGLHWPTLDDDLSFAGILDGRFGQHERAGNG